MEPVGAQFQSPFFFFIINTITVFCILMQPHCQRQSEYSYV